MEANRKRRGFMKGKLAMPFYRVAKSSTTMQYSSKIKPSQASSGFVVDQDYVVSQPKQKVSYIVDQEYVIPPPKQMVAFFIQSDCPYGAGDEGVDAKAANYISCVQERFKLDQVNSKKL